MWGGRFADSPDAIMEEINVSIDVDQHLYAQDIAASKAHAAMLAAQGIITANDAKNITSGLDTILSEIGKGSFTFKRALEDIHMNVESRLGDALGLGARGAGAGEDIGDEADQLVDVQRDHEGCFCLGEGRPDGRTGLPWCQDRRACRRTQGGRVQRRAAFWDIHRRGFPTDVSHRRIFR